MNLPYDQVLDPLESYNDDLDTSSSHDLSDHEKYLQERLETLKCDLSSLDKYENPILEKLEQRLTNAFQKCEGTEGIVFVRTREQAEAINNWIINSEFAHMVGIKSQILIGHLRKEGGLTMSDEAQKKVVKQFCEGKCNLLIATFVAEERLDIKQCNLVIRLHKSNAQMEGHARAEGSKIITIVSNDPMKLYKDMLNDELLFFLELLIQANALPTPQKLREEIIYKQKLIMDDVGKERELENSCMNSHPAGDVELRCRKCKILVCRGSDVYYIDNTNHHVVPGTDFSALYI